MISRFILILSILGVSPFAGAEEVLLGDPFTAEAEVPERRAMRGNWNFTDGVATCTQDDALYKKFKDHGPIIFYDLPTTDCTVRFQFKPEGCKSFVFTMNSDEGHVYRFVTSDRGTSVRAFPPDGEKKSIQADRANDWVLEDGEWTAVEVTVKGDKVTVKYGDHEPMVSEHPTFANARTNLSVGFAFGTWSVKDFAVVK